MPNLIRLIADILRLPQTAITDDLSMADTATWTSLSHLEIIIGIENEFSIELSGDDITAMTSVAGIRAVLAAKGVS